MKKNTVITPVLVQQTDNVITDDVRIQEYNVIVLPIDLADGDYVDIRLMTPNGQDFVVVSKKIVEIPQNSDGTYVADSVRMTLREDEILAMSSAIVEAAGINGAKLYATKYKEAGMQNAAVPTYRPNDAVTTLIGIDSSPEYIRYQIPAIMFHYEDGFKNRFKWKCIKSKYSITSIRRIKKEIYKSSSFS